MKKTKGKEGLPGRKKRVPDAELDFIKILQQNSLFSVSTGSILSPSRKPLKAISYENIVAGIHEVHDSSSTREGIKFKLAYILSSSHSDPEDNPWLPMSKEAMEV